MDATRSDIRPADRSPRSTRWVRTLGSIVAHAHDRGGDTVLRRDLSFGDRVFVSTRNSVYCLHVLGDDTFAVSGGWFEKNRAPQVVTVNGCTFGGSVIRQDVVAGTDMFLEFGNNILTTRIKRVRVVRFAESEDGPLATMACPAACS